MTGKRSSHGNLQGLAVFGLRPFGTRTEGDMMQLAITRPTGLIRAVSCMTGDIT